MLWKNIYCFVNFDLFVCKTESTTVLKPEPRNSVDIPETIPYLLIGGGTASFSAFRAIKSSCPTAKVPISGYYKELVTTKS